VACDWVTHGVQEMWAESPPASQEVGLERDAGGGLGGGRPGFRGQTLLVPPDGSFQASLQSRRRGNQRPEGGYDRLLFRKTTGNLYYTFMSSGT